MAQLIAFHHTAEASRSISNDQADIEIVRIREEVTDSRNC